MHSVLLLRDISHFYPGFSIPVVLPFSRANFTSLLPRLTIVVAYPLSSLDSFSHHIFSHFKSNISKRQMEIPLSQVNTSLKPVARMPQHNQGPAGFYLFLISETLSLILLIPDFSGSCTSEHLQAFFQAFCLLYLYILSLL